MEYFKHLPHLPYALPEDSIKAKLEHLNSRNRYEFVNFVENYLEQIDEDTDLLVSWVFTAYRGCVVDWRDYPSSIFPHLDDGDVYLVNSKHETETAFLENKRIKGGHTSVVFHGTSLDRLYPILWEGLQVVSQTSELSATKVAEYGEGIYTAKSSSVASVYCSWPITAKTAKPPTV